jgi:hypothetical protein
MSSAARMDKRRRSPSDGSTKLAAVKTNIPARLDRLPWCRFHVLVIVALGVTWILDGLEVTIVGSIGPVLQDSQTLALSAQQIGAAASSYVIGAVCGALIFGWLADRPVRPEVRVLCHADRLSDGRFAHRRVMEFLELRGVPGDHGVGIGGEYAGAAAGSGASLLFLDPNIMPVDLGWRFGFAIGGLLGLGIILLRGYVPESPRWLVTHCWGQQADASMSDIEHRVRSDTGLDLAPAQSYSELHPQKSFGLGLILRAMLQKYRERSLLALALMTAQAFLFNAVFPLRHCQHRTTEGPYAVLAHVGEVHRSIGSRELGRSIDSPPGLMGMTEGLPLHDGEQNVLQGPVYGMIELKTLHSYGSLGPGPLKSEGQEKRAKQ